MIRAVSNMADREYLFALLALNSTYHNHKEQAAYTILGVEGAFFLGLFLLGNWPPGVDSVPDWLLALAFGLTWVLFHSALRFQLRNRRLAALRVDALIRTLEDDCDREAKLTEVERHRPGRLMRFIDDTLWPVKTATIDGDLGEVALTDGAKLPRHSPAAYTYREATLKAEFAQKAAGKYGWMMEWIITGGSAFLLLAALTRIIFDPGAPSDNPADRDLPVGATPAALVMSQADLAKVGSSSRITVTPSIHG